MGDRNKQDSLVPDFDIVLWGYDRQQVRQCLDDMTARLEEALSQRDAVELLQAQLCEARVEIEQLRRAAEENPTAADRLSKIMMTAEKLRDKAAREAETVRSQTAAGELQPVSAGD